MLLLKTAPFLLIYFILFYVVLVCFIFCNWLRNKGPGFESRIARH